ncbi:hypothetical protein [Sphaerotilus mobilis]|jgi:hypothetical protein|uniref:Uncharacterized protein n=1 Tax=Sphaerotilus mobilis TaxID=47994 RepID=A0A4Q7LBR0_9BURK|nr:hypothetical protein [Sphaerotilus mobilis]RZS47506.1 hypothetical protein EV685_3714 [Sphaerotilus mobilis]
MTTNHGVSNALTVPQAQQGNLAASYVSTVVTAGLTTEGAAFQGVAAAAGTAVKAAMAQMLTEWVTGAAPCLGPDQDELSWFLSKRANALINFWLTSKKLAALEPRSPAGTGCVIVSRAAVEHCRDHRALQGVSQPAVTELLTQLFVHGSPNYAPNTSKGEHGKGYQNQLVMFDATYKALEPSAMGETPAGILQHTGAPYVHLKLVTAYWTKPGSVSKLRADMLKK